MGRGRSGLERARPVPIAARALGLAFAPFVALLIEVPVTVTWLGLALDAWRGLLGMAPRVACDGEYAIRDEGIGERGQRESAAACMAAYVGVPKPRDSRYALEYNTLTCTYL